MTEQKPGQGVENRQLTAQSGIQRFEDRWDDVPHEELVNMLGATVDEARGLWEAKWGKGSFDPVVWIGEKLAAKTFFKDDLAAKRLSLAWDALTQPYIKDREYKERVSSVVRDGASKHGQYFSLPPKAVKLIDAMAEVANVPKARGEDRVDLFARIPKLLR